MIQTFWDIAGNSNFSYLSGFNKENSIDQKNAQRNEICSQAKSETNQGDAKDCERAIEADRPKADTTAAKAPKKKRKPRPKIEYDANGWADARKFRPFDAYELIELRDVQGNVRPGWWNGDAFETSTPCKVWQFHGARSWRRWHSPT